MGAATGAARFPGLISPAADFAQFPGSLAPEGVPRFAFAATIPLKAVATAGREEATPETVIGTLLSTDALPILTGPAGTGRHLALSVLFRASVEDKAQADAALGEKRAGGGPLPDAPPVRMRIIGRRQPGGHESLTVLTNNSGIGSVLRGICADFDQLWSRQAFASWYPRRRPHPGRDRVRPHDRRRAVQTLRDAGGLRGTGAKCGDLATRLRFGWVRPAVCQPRHISSPQIFLEGEA